MEETRQVTTTGPCFDLTEVHASLFGEEYGPDLDIGFLGASANTLRRLSLMGVWFNQLCQLVPPGITKLTSLSVSTPRDCMVHYNLVLAEFPDLQELQVSGSTTVLGPLHPNTRLRKLHMTRVPHLVNIGGVARSPVEQVVLRHAWELRSLDPLSTCTRLRKSRWLGAFPSTVLTPWRGCPSKTSKYLGEVLTTLEPLSTCRHLRRIAMSDGPSITTLAPLRGLLLEHVEFSKLRDLTNIDSLAQCTNLSSLAIWDVPGVSNLLCLAGHPSLCRLGVKVQCPWDLAHLQPSVKVVRRNLSFIT